MSVFIGMLMGLVFTLFAQLKNQQQIIPMGILTAILISAVISFLLGLVIPVKRITDWACRKIKITPAKRLPFLLVNAFVSNIIFTPLNCCVNMWYGMAMGLTDVPSDVTNIFQRMAFCAGLPQFLPALLTSLLTSLIMGYVLCVIVLPFIDSFTNKICKIPAGPPPRP